MATATFLTEDSYLGNQTEPLTLNRYNYCVSSYLNYTDPSGKWIYEKDMEKFLNAGFIAFMIGHVFYIGAIYKFAGNWSVLTAVLPIIISVVVAMGNVIVSEKLLKLKFGKFRTIVGVYTFFLFMTFAVSAVAMLNNSFAKQWILTAVGGILFILSDAVLSNMYFKEGGNTKPNVIINHTLYYAAQFVIASWVLFIK